MKKVYFYLTVLIATAFNTAGVMGQTANSDPNSVMVHKVETKEQAIAQLDGSAKWDGRVSRDVLLTELTANLNRYVAQTKMGFTPADKDYFVSKIVPKLQVNTIGSVGDTVMPADLQIGGKSGADKISYNNRPDYIPGVTKFLTWDVRSYNTPGEVYRFYIARLECINPTIYMEKIEDKLLVETKEIVVHDTVPVYIKPDSVSYAVYTKEEEVSATTPTVTTPSIINNNYNYNTLPGMTGYSNGLYQPSYGGCYGSGWGFGMSWGIGFGSYGCGGFNQWNSGFYGCQQPYYQPPQPYYGGTTIIIEGDDITQTTTIHPWWPVGIGGNNDDGGPDEPDDDDDGDTGGPDVPDDDPDTGVLAGGDTGGPVIAGDNGNDGGPNTPDDGRLANAERPNIVGADEFATVAPVVKNASKEDVAYNMDKGEVLPSKPSPSKGDGVKQETKPMASDPKPGANQVGPKNTDTKPVAVAPNPGAGNNPKGEVAYNQQGTEPVASKPKPSGDGVKKDPTVSNPNPGTNQTGPKSVDPKPVSVDPKPVVNIPSKGNTDYQNNKPSQVYQGPKQQPVQQQVWEQPVQKNEKKSYNNTGNSGGKPQKTFSGPNPPAKTATRPTKTNSGKRGG